MRAGDGRRCEVGTRGVPPLRDGKTRGAMQLGKPWLPFLAAIAIALVFAACSPESGAPAVTPEVPEATPAPTDIPSTLFERTPFPYTTPLPPAQATILDGTYTSDDPSEVTETAGRCAPAYPRHGGRWTLDLYQGIFRLFHEGTGWNSMGSFTVSGDRVTFFNDLNCPESVGVYAWRQEAEQLILQVVEDECGFGLRTERFANLPWLPAGPGTNE
jgi:hypothetical protein